MSGLAAPVDAGSVAFLALDSKQWIYRRVESVEFIDHRSVRRRVSVDFQRPRFPWAVEESSFAPIALLDKQPLVSFDLVDESGRSLPMLTKSQNSALSSLGLKLLADRALNRAGQGVASAAEQQIFEDLVGGSPAAAMALLEELEAAYEGGDPRSKALLEDPLFGRYAYSLATSFLLIITALPDERRVLKFSYTESLESPTAMNALLSSLGVQSAVLQFDVPAIGESGSHHFELHVPEDLQIRDAALMAEIGGNLEVGERRLAGSTAHLYLGGDLPAEALGVAVVVIRGQRSGFLRGAWVSSLFTALVITYFSLNLDELRTEGSVASILLAIPGLLAFVISRPGEHRLATSLFFGPRVLVALCGFLAFAGAASLVTSVDPITLRAFWTALLWDAWACFTLLTFALIGLDWLIDGIGAATSGIVEWWRRRISR